jgi:predicted nucleotidyltransferase
MAKMTLDELVSQLRAAFGGELRAVVLYGSAAAGEHLPRKSDYNVLVLVESLAANRLMAASAAAKAWSDAGNPAPLMLTTSEWEHHADVFPMEYADVLERNKTLFGELPTNVRVDHEHLRLQLEHEAMGTLLQLRRAALAAGTDGKAQLELLESVSSTVMVILRAVLRLAKQAPPTDNVQLSEQVAALSGADAAPFVRVIRHKRGEAAAAIRPGDAGGVLAAYLASMDSLVRYLDQKAGRRS